MPSSSSCFEKEEKDLQGALQELGSSPETEACKTHKNVMISHPLRGVLRESSEL